MPRQQGEADSIWITQALAENGLNHLKVVGRGAHLVVYSEEDGDKVNRIRFTRFAADHDQLSVADHRGRWEATPYNGTIADLLALVSQDFPFTLAEFQVVSTDHP